MSQVNLVIQTAFLGDLILTIPVLQRIKKKYPSQKLAIVCKKGLGEFLLNEKIVDLVFEVQKSNNVDYKKIVNELGKLKINNLYCIHRSFRSLIFASRIKARRKVGFSSLLGFWVFDDTIEFVKDYPDVLRKFKILETTDEEVRREFIKEDFSNLNRMESEVPGFFSFGSSMPHSKTKKIGVFPGSVWATKRWTVEGYSQLVRKLLEKGYSVDLHGGPDERELCLSIAKEAGGGEVMAGQMSIAETVASIPNYDLIITNDSSPTHMAAFKDVAVVSVFGPTVLDQGFRPWSNRARVVENKTLACRPCGAHGHQVCPLTHHDCMKSIDSEQVLAAAQELL